MSKIKIIMGKVLTTILTSLLLNLVLFASPALAATSPTLGAADSFAVLGATAVTNVPTSTILGDVGLSPAAGTNYAGLTVLEVTGGTIYAVDVTGPAGVEGNNPGLLTSAQAANTAAFGALNAGDNAACTIDYGDVVTSLNGLTLGPGVYCSGTFELSGTLTLSGSGVWIFKSSSTLITSGTANVVGGDPCNVWWRVVSSATLGTNTQLIGNILALTSIDLKTGATLNGRALAQTGSVTMDSNVVTPSICAVPTPAPTLGKGFSPFTINMGGVSTLTITLSNPNTSVATLTAPLIDTLPTGVTIANTPNASTTCGGTATVSATAGGSNVTLSSGSTIPAAIGNTPGTCIVKVDVTALLNGSYLNTLPANALQTSNGNNTLPAIATLTVVPPVQPGGPPLPVPAFTPIGIAVLAGLLALFAIVTLRRRL